MTTQKAVKGLPPVQKKSKGSSEQGFALATLYVAGYFPQEFPQQVHRGAVYLYLTFIHHIQSTQNPFLTLDDPAGKRTQALLTVRQQSHSLHPFAMLWQEPGDGICTIYRGSKFSVLLYTVIL